MGLWWGDGELGSVLWSATDSLYEPGPTKSALHFLIYKTNREIAFPWRNCWVNAAVWSMITAAVQGSKRDGIPQAFSNAVNLTNKGLFWFKISSQLGSSVGQQAVEMFNNKGNIQAYAVNPYECLYTRFWLDLFSKVLGHLFFIFYLFTFLWLCQTKSSKVYKSHYTFCKVYF